MKEPESIERLVDELVESNEVRDNESSTPSNKTSTEEKNLKAIWQNLGELELPLPPKNSEQRFEKALSEFKQAHLEGGYGTSQAKPLAFRIGSLAPWLGLAAIFLFGFFLGNSFLFNSQERKDLAELRNELKASRELIALSMLQQASVSDRMRGALQCAAIEEPSAAFVPALIQTIQNDSSVNVRLAALGALAPFAHNETVIQEFRTMLNSDQPLLVKAQLIGFLAAERDEASLPVLQKLAEDELQHSVVREKARRALEEIRGRNEQARATKDDLNEFI